MEKMKVRVVILTILLVLISTAGLRAETDPFDIFQEVLFYIEHYHIDEQDREELFKGAIKGMVETLDIFSGYMTEEEYEEMQLEMDGHFGGIGISINPDLVIVAPIKGTPGEKVGLQSEDKIIAIDGEPTDDMTQQEAVNIMRGEPGTEVTLTISREGVEEELEFHIVRSDIEIPYVESELIDERIAYVSIAQFAQDVGKKTERAISELETQGAEALILDLRTNPGGLLSEAINVSSVFFDDGEVVSIRKRYGPDEVLQVEKAYSKTGLPVLVLINQGSASASEIVSGAIKDRDRGILLGKSSFGKGTVQTVIPFSDGTALRLTIGQYFTPAGNNIHEKGIEPDIEVDYDPDYDGDNQLEAAVEYIKENYFNEQLPGAA